MLNGGEKHDGSTDQAELHITARSSGGDLWLRPDFPGSTLTRVEVDDLVAMGRAGELAFVPRFRREYRGRRLGDLIWTGGIASKVASRRLVDALTDLGATGFSTYDVEIVGADLRPGEYVGLAVHGKRHLHVLWQYHRGGPADTIGITPALLEALTERGVAEFRVDRDTPP